MSRNELSWAMRTTQNWPQGMPEDFRREPQSSANGNLYGKPPENYPGASCGARSTAFASGLDVWQKWYDAANRSVPILRPGSTIPVSVRITADHMGQAWFQIACGTEFTESANWINLRHSGGGNFFAWRNSRTSITTSYEVPSSFSCPTEMAMGRWIWKTGNSCNDFNNVGRNTERFSRSSQTSNAGACPQGGNAETFISCFDFKGTWYAAPTPAPPPTPPPAPTPAPPPPGPCRHQTDCSVNPWCNDSTLGQWCAWQDRDDCPFPQCMNSAAGIEKKATSFLNLLRR